ncbi:hypothetical protein [Spirillospora sp. NPDC047279]|uniref:hypothetical protein n=1 Tax=Spirillospora sp. NPDC047279 TaxID=3155478 RepID=UPI0033E21FE0
MSGRGGETRGPGPGRLRRRLAIAAALLGLAAVASVVPPPETPFDGLTRIQETRAGP